MHGNKSKDEVVLAELEGVSKEFRPGIGKPPVQALKDVHIQVTEGEILGLLGPNGAGKTTTIKLILGLIFPTKGNVRLFGMPPSKPESRRRIGFLPENPYFYDYLTANEYMRLAAMLHGLDHETTDRRISELLAKLELNHAADRQLRKYSKGMLQRLGLAQALVNSPELVILDEPMSGLDPVGRREVRELIRELKKEGRTVLFSSHVLSDVEAVCDRVVIMNNGRIAAQGLLSDLLSQEVTSVEFTLQAASPELERTLTGRSCVVSRAGDTLYVRLSQPDKKYEIMDLIRSSGAQIASMNPLRPSLEDIFMKQIGNEEAGR